MRFFDVDPYLFPARGRKPWLLFRGILFITNVDPYLFPARGRKPRKILGVLGELPYVDPYLFPARGRKQTIKLAIKQNKNS